MSPQDKRLQSILRRHGLTHCPACATPITAAHVRWGVGRLFATYGIPVIVVACPHCRRYVRAFHVPVQVRSLDHAIDTLTAVTDLGN
jgi:hypothetical protein